MKLGLYHNVGFNPCYELGGYFTGENFTTNTILRAEDFELIDGTKPEHDSVLRCGSCGEYMHITLDCLIHIQIIKR